MAVTRGSLLLVERPDAIDRVETALGGHLNGEHIETASSVAAAEEALVDHDIVCVLSNLEVPDSRGIEHLRGLDVLDATRAHDAEIPVVLFTTAGHEDASRIAIGAGADTHILRCVDDQAFEDLAHRSQQLANKRRAERRAERHARINEVLRDVNETLVRASTREAIERGVCRQLIKATQHVHAVYALEDDGVEICAQSATADIRADPSVFEGLNVTTDTVWLYNDLGEAPESLRVFGQANDYRSMLMLPVVYRDQHYGVVAIFSSAAYAFDKTLWTVFGELGQTIGYAQSAVETQRELARQNERLDEFARMVSHDLRNPLTIINGRLELAKEREDPEHFAAIERAAERMETLIDDMLRRARDAGAENKRPVALTNIAARAWKQVATGGASLELGEDCMFQAEPGRLQQLLENLFRNAIEHGTDEGQTIPEEAIERGVGDATDTVVDHQPSQHEDATTETEDTLTVRVGALDDGFFVEDTGPGIPPEVRHDIFDYGYSTAEQNTGYGLSIVAQIAEDHSWSIAIEDSPEGGARFEITGVER